MRRQSIGFPQYITDLLENTTTNFAPPPLKEQPQLQSMVDTLSRYHRHHLILRSTGSEKIDSLIMHALAQHISEGNTPKSLKQSRIFYFDAARFALTLNSTHAEQELLSFLNEMRSTEKRIIFIINAMHPIGNLIKPLLSEEPWRFIFIASPDQIHQHPSLFAQLESLSAVITLKEPTPAEYVALLKGYRPLLEEFHNVIISDETFSMAYTLAGGYFPGNSCFDKALELLDSGSARASTIERTDLGYKPVVTSHLLAQIIASWTQIPIANLQHTKFQTNKFSEALRNQIFGQDTAINLITATLQNACVSLQEKTRPLCNLLLVGQASVGKSLAAITIAEHLFDNKDAIFQIDLLKNEYHSIDEITVTSKNAARNCDTLLNAIKRTPYAIILIENINLISATTFKLFHDILSQGYAIDSHGNKYDFRHAIIIMTTRLASDEMSQLQKNQNDGNTTGMDLMHLVLNEPTHSGSEQQYNYSPSEIREKLFPKLTKYFPEEMLHLVNIIPFMPLDYSPMEKIIRIKLKALTLQLQKNFGIELTLAPEVIKFVTQETLWRKPISSSIDNALEHLLYSCIAHEIMLRADDKNRSKRLLVQLNSTGETLRCEFILSHETNLYKA